MNSVNSSLSLSEFIEIKDKEKRCKTAKGWTHIKLNPTERLGLLAKITSIFILGILSFGVLFISLAIREYIQTGWNEFKTGKRKIKILKSKTIKNSNTYRNCEKIENIEKKALRLLAEEDHALEEFEQTDIQPLVKEEIFDPLKEEKEEFMQDVLIADKELDHLKKMKVLQPIQEKLSLEDAKAEQIKVEQAKEFAGQMLAKNGLIDVGFSEGFKKFDIYELEDKELRELFFVLSKECPQMMHPLVLKEKRDVNLKQYLMIKIKQFSHIEQLKGFVPFPDNKVVRLEGWFEVFCASTVLSLYDTFSKTSNFFEPKDKEWIFSQFNQMIFSDYLPENEAKNLSINLRNPDFVGPFILQSGFIDHLASFTWFGNYLLYQDRSSIHTDGGTYVLHIPDRELITEDFINEMIKRKEMNQSNYRVLEKFLSFLNATVVYYAEMPDQIVGNCTHATMETVLRDVMALKDLLNTQKGHLDKIEASSWKAAFEKIKPEYDRWYSYQHQLIFDTTLDDIEEWLTHRTNIGNLPLKKTYQQLLESWLNPIVQRNPLEIQKVKNILKKLEKDPTF